MPCMRGLREVWVVVLLSVTSSKGWNQTHYRASKGRPYATNLHFSKVAGFHHVDHASYTLAHERIRMCV